MGNQKEQPTLKTFADGSKEWWQNGQLHRLDGPAVELADGTKFWFINGNELSESEFKRIKQLQPNQPNEKPLSFFDSLIL